MLRKCKQINCITDEMYTFIWILYKKFYNLNFTNKIKTFYLTPLFIGFIPLQLSHKWQIAFLSVSDFYFLHNFSDFSNFLFPYFLLNNGKYNILQLNKANLISTKCSNMYLTRKFCISGSLFQRTRYWW